MIFRELNGNLKNTLAAILLVLFAQQSLAFGIESSDLPSEQSVGAIPDKLEAPSQTNWKTGTYGPQVLEDVAETEEALPFGSHLFRGGFRGVRADGLNPTYKIMPGDQITLRLWGSIDVDRVMPVDSHGNIFIPSVGPVKIQGLPHSQLDARVRGAVKTIYPENVYVYTNLQGVQPVAVFVTGYTNNPGRYAGTPSDSILYFLDQAGGIDSALGSYRKIRIIRNDETIAHTDLYDFLLTGKLNRLQFRDGDTIIVEERESVVTVTGEVPRSQHYELLPNELDGRSLLKLTQVQSNVSHILQRGGRSTGPISIYHKLTDFPGVKLHDGDEMLFSADQRDETIVVQLEGSFYGPSRYVLKKDARLQELLDTIAVPESLTDINSISIRRVSVAERQKKTLIESLRRLETTYLGAPSSTPDEAKIRAAEAELISSFVVRASQAQPSGRLVVAEDGEITDIRLQDGDIITIPEISDAILISGEVLIAQSMVFKPEMNAIDYIQRSGGFTQHADKNQTG